jgi:DNA-binding transcriptional regulator YiaG
MSKKMGAPLRFPEPTGDPARDRIINLRRRLGLSQAGLGERLGISDMAVSLWESGRTVPSGPALKLLEMLERE